jgi:hypothetical protein
MNTPAFPRPLGANGYGENDSQKGMTLLDYFAAAAMQKYLSHRTFPDNDQGTDTLVSESYKIAVKMLKERVKYEHIS